MSDPAELRRDKSLLRKELFDVQAKLNNPTYGGGEREMFQRRERQIFDAMDAIDKQLLELSQQQTETMSAQAPPPSQPSPQQAPAPNTNAPNDVNRPSRFQQAAHWGRQNVKPIAAGAAAGAATAAAVAHAKAQQGLRTAASGVGYVSEQAPRHGGTFAFIVFAFFVISFEYYSAFAGSWPARLGFYFVLVMITFAMFRSMNVTKRAAIAAIIMNALWWIYLTGADVMFVSNIFQSEAGMAIATIFILPGFLWYLLFLEPEVEVAGLFRGIGGVVIAGVMLAAVYPLLSSAGGLVPTPATGFDPAPAARDAGSYILGGAGGAFQDFLCWIGLGGGSCSFADSWLARITEPFSYDATTVHEIQNRNLGVFIRDARVDGTIDVSGYGPGSFLPRSIEFYVHAPIPEDLEIELCNARAQDLKGFAGICDNEIKISCTVDGVSTTQIIPRDQLSIRGAVASLGSLFSCRMQVPDDDALLRSGGSTTKRAQVSVEYPFVTTTFKLIRAVSLEQATNREALAELRNFRESRVISSGGPVIVEVSDSEFITVDDSGARESLVIRLQAEPQVRIEGIDSMFVLVPSGSELVSAGPGSYCDFVMDPVRISQERDLLCSPTPTCGSGERLCDGVCVPGGIAELECPSNEFGREGGSREGINVCDLELDDLIGQDLLERPGTVYFLSKAAIDRINSDIASGLFEQDARWTSAAQRTNSIAIGCELNVNDRDAFLHTERLVTERALNIITSYRVSHTQDLNVRFAGRATEMPRTPSTAMSCPVPGLNLAIPVGIMPVTGSGNRLTDPFGTPRNNNVGYHIGVDIASPTPGGSRMIRAAWDGVIEYVESGCQNGDTRCGSRYGNYVVIRTKTPSGTFTHIYAHIAQGDSTIRGLVPGRTIRAGEPIGMMGTTGLSTGNHLHFEVRAAQGNIPLNPLLFLPESEVRALGGFTQTALKSEHDVRCSQITHDFLSDDIVNMRGSVSDIAGVFGTHATDEKVRKVIDAAIEQGIPPDVLLGVVMQENRFSHHEGIGNQGTWTSRSGETIALSVDGESVGMMQIQAVGRQTLCTDRWREYQQANPGISYADAQVDLDFHIRCGAEILKFKYTDAQRLLNTHGAYCGAVCSCVPSSSNNIEVEYDQRTIFPQNINPWIAGVKGYNGWGCQPTPEAAAHYVNQVFEYARQARNAAGVSITRVEAQGGSGSSELFSGQPSQVHIQS